MKRIFAKTWSRFKSDERGVTLVEYGIALILAVTLGGAALATLGTAVGGKMGAAETCLSTTGC
ncbi:Flp family type IVb pilin [Falsihalocynthiibacter sp. BN13B15]|uniref:Flp family type IVb pilin n=1 Tax=Falsihalocynthiibacter sp. BN13B15 TaxID=3240871 RepID=UPI003510C8E9